MLRFSTGQSRRSSCSSRSEYSSKFEALNSTWTLLTLISMQIYVFTDSLNRVRVSHLLCVRISVTDDLTIISYAYINLQ